MPTTRPRATDSFVAEMSIWTTVARNHIPPSFPHGDSVSNRDKNTFMPVRLSTVLMPLRKHGMSRVKYMSLYDVRQAQASSRKTTGKAKNEQEETSRANRGRVTSFRVNFRLNPVNASVANGCKLMCRMRNCDWVFKRPEDAKEHLKAHKLCIKAAESSASGRRPSELGAHWPCPSQSPMCTAMFKTREDLKMHKRALHPVMLGEIRANARYSAPPRPTAYRQVGFSVELQKRARSG
ncbi:hypothetical protein BKA62DRAFT_91183 [Auriculariales sp. MPI-PUGE-AT-0066]|nr:hypothetical protein BKA62DRAFT_91183 [Auriculariales sp. MPI-PUGE-AT-0066]